MTNQFGELSDCKWRGDEDHWESSCGQAFVFFDGDPFENGFVFCPYCGKPIGVIQKEELLDEEE